VTTCVTQCPDGKFNNKGSCSACNVNCQTCQDAETCASCATGLVLQSNACQNKCNSGYFQNPSNVCQSCNPACSACTGPAIDQCLGCVEGYLISGTTCSPGCPKGKYLANGKCPTCDASCSACSDGSTCTECTGTLYLKDAKCISDCGTDFFANTKSNECTPCAANCATCTSAAQNACLTCDAGLVL
jgi:proprotein convertase subtilisin/kexin type 5